MRDTKIDVLIHSHYSASLSFWTQNVLQFLPVECRLPWQPSDLKDELTRDSIHRKTDNNGDIHQFIIPLPIIVQSSVVFIEKLEFKLKEETVLWFSNGQSRSMINKSVFIELIIKFRISEVEIRAQ